MATAWWGLWGCRRDQQSPAPAAPRKISSEQRVCLQLQLNKKPKIQPRWQITNCPLVEGATCIEWVQFADLLQLDLRVIHNKSTAMKQCKPLMHGLSKRCGTKHHLWLLPKSIHVGSQAAGGRLNVIIPQDHVLCQALLHGRKVGLCLWLCLILVRWS